MRFFITILFIGFSFFVKGQELYPWSEPASNMPSNSISLKNMSMFSKGKHSDKTIHRHMPDIMIGLNKKWMIHAGLNFSNMHSPDNFIWEGARAYAKYRFLSLDDVHKHFRMAVFGAGSYSRNHLDHNEISIQMGEQSGVQAGLILTQLWNRFAISATGSWNEVLDKKRNDEVHRQHYAFQSINYSLSAGYLILPFEYTSYDQLNLNVYTELIGSRNMNFPSEKYFVDLAPSLQLIFNSSTKVNVGYRFQLNSDINRLTNNSFMLGFEHIFFNALKKKRSNGLDQ